MDQNAGRRTGRGMNEIAIRAAGPNDAERLAALIAEAFLDVAEGFGLTRENCPSHTSFVTADEVRRGMGFGNRYFMAFSGGTLCGAIAFRLPKGGISIVEKVAVLPSFRRHGIGWRLVEHAFAEARQCGASTAEIGIIAEHTGLRAWYERLGFRPTRQTRYEHLPFEVLHMQKYL
jgi:GNAT superfamily N-acetyltransferase